MRYVMLLLVPAVALLMAADDQADKDKKALQGTWKVASLEKDGQAVPAEKVEDMKFDFKDDTFSRLSDGQRTESGTFKLDPTKKPKAMDATHGNAKESTPFIYEIDGDTLKLCWRKPGGERPKEFTGKGTDGYIVLKREK
jgi:uncharacterized protein (TIGR03067 family)